MGKGNKKRENLTYFQSCIFFPSRNLIIDQGVLVNGEMKRKKKGKVEIRKKKEKEERMKKKVG